MILFVFYTAKVDTALKGDAKKTVTRIILSEKKEMDDLNKEVESEQREEEKEDLTSKLEDLEDIDEVKWNLHLLTSSWEVKLNI